MVLDNRDSSNDPIGNAGSRPDFLAMIKSKFKRTSRAKTRANGRIQSNLDKKLVLSLSKSRIPSPKQFKYLKRFLSKKELWVIRICVVVIISSLAFMGVGFYNSHLQVVPVKGGSYTEGLIGYPKYINPLYSTNSDVDHDLARLVYSSLFTRDGQGKLAKDLVEDYQVSENGLIYTFRIRRGVKWHDGTDLTADDIVFTFSKITDSDYKSPLRTSFLGVELEKINDYEIKFILESPYAAFLETLVFGIMPADHWYRMTPETAYLIEYNRKPVGSGEYKFAEYTVDKSGTIKEYNLVPNQEYYGKAPLVDLSFRFYPNFEEAIAALNNKEVEGISYLPQSYKADVITPRGYHFHKMHLPQLTLIFLNEKKNQVLENKSVRAALAHGIDRQSIVKDILGGDAEVINGPILASCFAYTESMKKYGYNPEEAASLLAETGWEEFVINEEDIASAQEFLHELEQKEEELSEEEEEKKQKAEKTVAYGEGRWRQKEGQYLQIRLSTIERSENEQIIRAVKSYWEDIGVKTELEILPAEEIRSEVIKPRNFEALFYGQIIGSDPDPYAFWHSSQIGENGLNIADFANKEVDQLLEDARIINDQAVRKEKYVRFQKLIAEQIPAIFMYSPIYTYLQANKIKNYNVTNILYPSDRFANVSEWYIETGKKLIW